MKVLKKIHGKSFGYEIWKEYNEFGRETSTNDSTGYWSRTKYDERGYTIHRYDSLGLDESRIYDENGNLIQVRSGEHITEQYFYNDQGNLVRSEFYKGDGKLKNWNESKYDERGNCIHTKDSDGNESRCEYNENALPVHLVTEENLGTNMTVMVEKHTLSSMTAKKHGLNMMMSTTV